MSWSWLLAGTSRAQPLKASAFVPLRDTYSKLGKITYWKKLEREWKSALEKYKAEEFHSKDFYSRNSDGSPVGI